MASQSTIDRENAAAAAPSTSTSAPIVTEPDMRPKGEDALEDAYIRVRGRPIDPAYVAKGCIVIRCGPDHYYFYDFNGSWTVAEFIEKFKKVYSLTDKNITLWFNGDKLVGDKTLTESGVVTFDKPLSCIELLMSYDDEEPATVPYAVSVPDMVYVNTMRESRKGEKEAQEKARREQEEADRW